MNVELSDSLEFISKIENYDLDIIYCDPPYALGSKVIIRDDGKVDYSSANDFMNKWEMPTGDYWEQWFKQAFKNLKYGGRVIMFGMDRQLLLFKYYAQLAGFDEQQSLYWYFISNFPKATDLSKMLESYELNGKANTTEFKKLNGDLVNKADNNGLGFAKKGKELDYRPNNYNETSPQILQNFEPLTENGKKYEGYKYSISPLKQTNETIMVFQKPTKTGSPLHDTLAYENGDETISVSALNIDGNRVETNQDLARINKEDKGMFGVGNNNNNKAQQMKEQGIEYGGRYPAQTFIDDETAEILDKQSGVSKSTGGRIGNKGSELNMMGTNYEKGDAGYGDVAGCSKILHKCNFTDEELVYMDFENDSDCVWSELTNQWKDEKELKSWLDDYFMKDIIIDFNFKNYQRIIIDSDRKMVVPLLHKCDYDKADYDLYSYEPKVSGREREAGCKGFEKEQSSTGLDYRGRVLERDDGSKTLVTRFMREPSRNNHPTLKPISLNERILKLFKTPNDQKICYAFAGAGSEVIGGIKAGFDNWVACEINQEYVDIANARIKYWKETMTTQLDLFSDIESEV